MRRTTRTLASALSAALAVAALGGAASAQAAGPPSAITSYNTPEPGGKARLVAYVNPNGVALSDCRFEYGPGEGYGEEAPCEGSIGAGTTPVEAITHLTGLTPGATYHYRVDVASTEGSETSADATFTAARDPGGGPCPNPHALGSDVLAECRAWEMVSPPDKNGGGVAEYMPVTSMAADGSAVEFSSLAAFGDASGAGIDSQYESVRTGEGWQTHGLLPPQPPTTAQGTVALLTPHYLPDFSSDLEKGVLRLWKPLDQQDPNVGEVANLYLRTDMRAAGPGHYELITACPLCTKPLSSALLTQAPKFVEASRDFRHILFESSINLATGAKAANAKLYEWFDGTVRLVGVLPNGTPALESIAGQDNGPLAGPLPPEPYNYNHHVISADGSKIFFRDGAKNLYMRLNGEETVQLNLSEKTPPQAPAPAKFWDASVDGSRVFFTSTQALTEGGGSGLYMYDTSRPPGDPDNLTYIGPASVVIGASADGNTVYFATNSGQLVPGAPQGGSQLLYAWQDGELRFISEVDPEGYTHLGDDALVVYEKFTRVSPDGELLFPTRQLIGPTGNDQGDCGAGLGKQPCREFYLYNPHSSALYCVSCDPAGAPPGTEAVLNTIGSEKGAIPPVFSHLSRGLSDDGGRAFFSSSEPLVPEDTNGVSDAYAFDAETATVHLISSGTDPRPSHYMESSGSGSDVLFSTSERVSRWDVDSNYDFYDARVDGGLPEPSPPAPSCNGDACQPVPPQLNDPTPASSSYRGAHGPRQGVKKHRRKHRHKHRVRKHGAKAAGRGGAGR